jgi:16S rRNA (uracil1498-N3)-methyltransferase
MTRRRWIADEFSADHATLIGEHAAHLARTLRARVGQEFEVACGDQVRRAIVASVADNLVEFTLAETIFSKAVAPITLLLAIFKFDRMAWAIEKCTELNVATIVPLIARRTEKHLGLAAEKRVERWRRIAREASQQARRTAAPTIDSPMPLGEALRINAGLRIVLAENERGISLSELLQSHDADSLSLAIGPEGGWTDDELRSFAESGWTAASLGNTILRAETAAIAAMAIATANL